MPPKHITDRRNICFAEFANQSWFTEIYIPYVWGSLRAFAEQHNDIVSEYNWQEPLYDYTNSDDVLEQVDSPDVFAFSGYMWNWNKSLKLSQKVKTKYPKCSIIAGGPQVVHSPELLRAHPWIDISVCGAGEQTFRDILLERLNEAPDFSHIPGIHFRNNGHVYAGATRDRVPEDIDAPSPYTAGYLDKVIDEVHSKGKTIVARVETNRGCPYRCTYCGHGTIAHTHIHHFPKQRTVEDIRYLTEKQVFGIYCLDANLGMYEQDTGFTDTICSAKKRTGYPKFFFSSMAKNSNDRVFQISKQLYQHGLLSRGGNISVQSMNLSVLENIDRKMIGINKYMDLKKKYTELGIPTLTELIVGLPGETFETFKQSFYTLQNAGFHDGYGTFALLMLPNTPMSKPEYQEKHGIRYVTRPVHGRASAEEDLREEVNLVIKTNSMSETDWVKMRVFEQVMRVFHSGGPLRFLAIYLNALEDTAFAQFYDELFDYFWERSETIFGSTLNTAREAYQRIVDLEEADQAGSQKYKFSWQKQEVELTVSPYRFVWYQCSLHRDAFFREFAVFLREILNIDNPRALEALRFQQSLWLHPSYDPEEGKVEEFGWDWIEFFTGDGRVLNEVHIGIKYQDQQMGYYSQVEIVPNDLNAFFKASQSIDPAERQRYVHQFDKLEKITTYNAGANCDSSRSRVGNSG